MPRGQQSMLSQSNMSDIKESIQQYSMNFQNSQNLQYISQAISMSKTANNISVSKPSKAIQKKNNIKIVDKQAQKPQIRKTQQSIIQEQDDKQNASNININNHDSNNDPINLGDQVFKIIAERYREVQGNQTYNPDVLFDFYKRQKKNYQPSKSTVKNVTMNDLGALMPSSQRKLLLKLKFQNILSYHPHDVYYTLVCGAEKYKKDVQLQNKANKLNQYLQQRPQSKKKNTNQVVQRLYPLKKQQQKQKPNQIQQSEKRNLFGTRLLEHFINNFRSNSQPPEPSAQKLYQFWQDTYERQEHGIQWDQSRAKQDIKLFMMEQVQNLLIFLQRKLGFKALNQIQLKKFYLQYAPINSIVIPPKYFKTFVNAYNDIMKEKQDKKNQQQTKKLKQQQQKRKQRDLKRFGRPVSATPISVLSKPKTAANFSQLSAYANDKILSTILLSDKTKIARRPFEYGIYDMEDEVKTKGRIKPKQKQNFDQTIFKQLAKTYTNTNFFNPNKLGRVIDILGEQQIQKQKNWKQLGPILQQAMLVQCYEQVQFRQALQRYCHKLTNKDLKYDDDKVVIQQLMKHLNNLDQDKRGDQVSILQSTLKKAQDKALRQKEKRESGGKSSNSQLVNKNLFYSFLTQKASKFVQMRVKHEQINLRKYLNDIFQTAMKQEKYQQFVKKHFHVVHGEKQCPKLLKYEFFRIQKDINPLTLQKDEKAKCHAWIPTKNGPQSFNYKTFNTYSNAYKIDKNKIVSKQEPDNHKRSLWGYKKDKAKLRENLLMTFEDAKQCVFHPKISKM